MEILGLLISRCLNIKNDGENYRKERIMKALVYGETIWDVFPEEQVIGGAPINLPLIWPTLVTRPI